MGKNKAELLTQFYKTNRKEQHLFMNSNGQELKLQGSPWEPIECRLGNGTRTTKANDEQPKKASKHISPKLDPVRFITNLEAFALPPGNGANIAPNARKKANNVQCRNPPGNEEKQILFADAGGPHGSYPFFQHTAHNFMARRDLLHF